MASERSKLTVIVLVEDSRTRSFVRELLISQSAEKIALLVPTWSIETWLLALLGEQNIDEARALKTRFEHRTSSKKKDLRAAAIQWPNKLGSDLPSLTDGRGELERIDP